MCAVLNFDEVKVARWGREYSGGWLGLIIRDDHTVDERAVSQGVFRIVNLSHHPRWMVHVLAGQVMVQILYFGLMSIVVIRPDRQRVVTCAKLNYCFSALFFSSGLGTLCSRVPWHAAKDVRFIFVFAWIGRIDAAYHRRRLRKQRLEKLLGQKASPHLRPFSQCWIGCQN